MQGGYFTASGFDVICPECGSSTVRFTHDEDHLRLACVGCDHAEVASDAGWQETEPEPVADGARTVRDGNW